MILAEHEILGSDMPIFEEKPDNLFTLEEIIYLEENADNYEIVGYLPVEKNDNGLSQMLYLKLYKKKGE